MPLFISLSGLLSLCGKVYRVFSMDLPVDRLSAICDAWPVRRHILPSPAAAELRRSLAGKPTLLGDCDKVQ